MKIEKTAVKTKSISREKEIQGVIRLKAYELYLKRNATAGDELEDWLTPEKKRYDAGD